MEKHPISVNKTPEFTEMVKNTIIKSLVKKGNGISKSVLGYIALNWGCTRPMRNNTNSKGQILIPLLKTNNTLLHSDPINRPTYRVRYYSA